MAIELTGRRVYEASKIDFKMCKKGNQSARKGARRIITKIRNYDSSFPDPLKVVQHDRLECASGREELCQHFEFGFEFRFNNSGAK